MEWLQTVCNLIIIVGGAIIAIKNVAEWLGKPIRLFKKKSDENFDEKVVEIIKREMPDLFLQHDLQIRDQYRADREQYLKDITAEVLRNIKGELRQVSDLTEQYETLCISAKDVLREKIMQMYFKNKKDNASQGLYKLSSYGKTLYRLLRCGRYAFAGCKKQMLVKENA